VSQRPWLRPPVLRMQAPDESDGRHASWLELFFDLVFVVAVAELAQELARDHSLGGFAIFAGLFLPVFIAWQGFTFYADRFDSDDVLFRVVMLQAGAAWALDGGAALYLLCLTIAQQVTERGADARAARALAGIALVVLAAAVGILTPVSLVACSAAALVALVIYEIRLGLAQQA
jgi:low temperature requirement protein LtrA